MTRPGPKEDAAKTTVRGGSVVVGVIVVRRICLG
jgi:hypothetical protein